MVDASIRVLLERGPGPFVLPQPGRAYRAEVGGEFVWLWGPLEMTAVAETAWQVGAWSNVESADGVVGALGERFGGSTRVWREPAGKGLYRVKLKWPDGDPADAKVLLAAAGHADAFRVSGGGGIRITGLSGAVEVSSEVVLNPAGDWPIVVSGRRYRGRLRLRVSGGNLLLINELAMEDYLRGVVPVEMGPYAFPELEALKAQAVAARTYAVAHLGDHDDEGWDICDTPACQAYHGAGAEHGLTDRAVAETAGLIAVYDSEPIDAMYTSTCGGHTEDSSELFSGRAQPYLRGVACAWERPLTMVGEIGAGTIGDRSAFRRWLALQALGPRSERMPPQKLLPAVAELCGGELRTLPAETGLEEWTESLLAAAGLDSTGPLAAGKGAERLVRLADLFEIPLPPAVPEDWDQGWHLEAVVAVLELQGLLVMDRGEAIPHPDGVAIYPRRADASEPLIQPLPLLWRWDGSYGYAELLEVLPGTLLERVRMGERTLAVVVVRSRGDSGRVVELAIISESGSRRLVTGFDVRRALDLPETLFEMHLRTDAEGRRSAVFLGRGWGHGVGLCQNGAYGLARSGMDFYGILKHYYTGIEVTSWR